MGENITKILIALINRISKKAAIISLAMILIYLLGTAGVVNNLILCIVIITGLAVLFTILQVVVESKDKIVEKSEE